MKPYVTRSIQEQTGQVVDGSSKNKTVIKQLIKFVVIGNVL